MQAILGIWELIEDGHDPRINSPVATRALAAARDHLQKIHSSQSTVLGPAIPGSSAVAPSENGGKTLPPDWSSVIESVSSLLHWLQNERASRRTRLRQCSLQIPATNPGDIDVFNDAWDRLDALWEEVLGPTFDNKSDSDDESARGECTKGDSSMESAPSPSSIPVRRSKSAPKAKSKPMTVKDALQTELAYARRARFHERRRAGPVMRLLLAELSEREDEVLELRRLAAEDKDKGKTLA